MKNIPSLRAEIRSDMVRFAFGVVVRRELDWELETGFGVGSDWLKGGWSWS
jgi:hypothetical protein